MDDDATMHAACRRVLEAKGYEIVSALNGRECLTYLENAIVDLVLLDYKMPDLDGIEVLCRIRQGDDPDLGVVIITGKGDMRSAIEALRLGALDYVTKPMGADGLLAVVQRGLEVTSIKRHLRRFNREGKREFRPDFLIGENAQMQQVCETLVRVGASSLSCVLLRGETGTGKSLVARALHDNSLRAASSFVQVNCTAIAADLAEVELFGHEKGAFTDAHGSRKGYVEQADAGTLFLDEIGYMPLSLQPKLLNVIEDKRFRRVGGFEDVTVDTRVVAATNRDLGEAIGAGEFREDLFYRLNVITLTLPPLRERQQDVLLLARHFLSHFSKQFHRDVWDLSPEAQKLVLDYHWPGNVREL
ncbi:MAG: sigma-54-dependent Fis family transcriptional regulator, partial [Armatimonadetes bacterium]|nr:sigma-54-dependent Fis family transcriptional regulator [Armatimonadota bacterium]